jgi:hypothetical protein
MVTGDTNSLSGLDLSNGVEFCPLWSGIGKDKARLSGAPIGEIGGTF